MLLRTLRTWMVMAPLAAFALALAPTAQGQEMPPDDGPPGTEPPQEPPPEEPPPEQTIPGLEEPHPLVVLHAINQIQSQLGLMGVNEATNTNVRNFAGDLAESYSRFDRNMLETANDLDIDVAGSGEVRIAMEQRLQNLDPQLHLLMEAPQQAFDAAFLDLVETSQQDAIETVQQLREEVQEEQVRRLMDTAIEGYQSHLQRAQQLKAQMGGQDAEPQGP